MNLKELKKIINSIPAQYNNTNISIICNHKEYFINSYDDIEWYIDNINNNKKVIDISIN